MTKKLNLTLGADPEVFIANKTSKKGTPTYACGRFGGTKGRAVPIHPDYMKDGFGLQEDNVMLEFNIPPAANQYDFRNFISFAMAGLKKRVDEEGYKILYGTEFLFPMEILKEASGAMEFGCSPDFNAYEDGAPWKKIKPDMLCEDGGQWRFAGGHLHLGGYGNEIPHFVMAHFCDIALALPVVAEGFDMYSRKRRDFYGQPGRFRPTSYGIEYRTLSNFWLMDSYYTAWVAMQAFSLMNKVATTSVGELQRHYQEIPWEMVRTTIQTNDVSAARLLVKENFLGLADKPSPED